jgi:preprotein translocase SecE subunit
MKVFVVAQAAPEKGSRWRSQQQSRAAAKTDWVRYNDVRTEMRKVTTPSRKEVQGTTTVVIITVFLFGLYFWLVDTIIGKSLDHFLKSLTSR